MADQAVVTRLLAKCTPTVAESALDFVSCTRSSSEGSTINNEGWASQIRYLLDAGVSEATIIATIDGDDS